MSEIHTVRNHARDSWRWVWPDVLIRLIPFWVVAFIAAHFMGGFAAIGWVAPPQGWPAAIAVGVGVGVIMMVLAMFWRWQISPGYRLPTTSDQALQTFFYFILNAPTEEIFWRGVVQTLAIRGLVALGLEMVPSAVIGIAVISAIFGAYHRLGGYPWKFNIAAMLAGALFGTLYVALPGPSIVVPSIVHALTTAGYLSWGDVALHRYRLRRIKKRIADRAV